MHLCMCVRGVRVLCVHYNLTTPSTTRTICSVIDSLWLGGSRCVGHRDRRTDGWPFSAYLTWIGGRGMEENCSSRQHYVLNLLGERPLQIKSPANAKVFSHTIQDCNLSLVTGCISCWSFCRGWIVLSIGTALRIRTPSFPIRGGQNEDRLPSTSIYTFDTTCRQHRLP
jgi:hypothetical protein